MLYLQLLTEAVMADREREIRKRLPRQPGIPSGRRHPAEAEGGQVGEDFVRPAPGMLPGRRAALGGHG